MKKFKLKKGCLVKIEGFPIRLPQDIIVESETDLLSLCDNTQSIEAVGTAIISEKN